MGPYTVIKPLSDQNYLISTPERRKHQLCQVNLLKAYHERESSEKGQVAAFAHPVCVINTVKDEAFCEEGLPYRDSALLTGRLKNSEVLADLNGVLDHLSGPQRTELVGLIQGYPCLFGDVPSCTNVLEHDVDVADAEPIRQRFYRVNHDERTFLDAEVSYMLENGIAEPSSSSWASPCLLVLKSDNIQKG